jgi:integrase/recombinase XerC
MLRLGLMGLRVSEIAALNVGNIDRVAHRITWTGKGHKPRQASYGDGMADLLDRYLRRYAQTLRRSLTDADPVIVCKKSYGRSLDFGRRCRHKTLRKQITALGAAAGLGHIAPHDLRRSAAGILHRTTDHTGAHMFDLLDIQKVLGHSDPATTMRSYLDPMDTGVYDRAGSILD